MGVDHPDNLRQDIEKLRREVRRLSKMTMQNASIGRAGLRVYAGGRILFEGGGGIEIEGDGFIIIDGDLTGAGELNWTGPWAFAGDGEITGDVDMTGEFNAIGPWKLTGDGEIEGDVDLTGELKSGNIRIAGGKIYVGAGGTQIVIDGATGKITAGNMTIDPTSGGSVSFPGGALVRGGSGGGVEVVAGSYRAVVTSAGASLGKSGLNVSVTDGNAFQFVGLPTINRTTIGSPPVGTVYSDGTGKVYRAV